MLEQDKDNIISIVSEYLPHARVLLFGSRARGDNIAQSDIDIAIDNQKKIDFFVLSSIKEAIEESSIPFRVDVVDLQSASRDLKSQIIKEGVVWKQ